MTHRRVAGIGCALLAALAVAAALYLAFGHPFITSAAEEGRRAVLRNLLSGGGPFTAQDYVASADHVAGTLFIVWLAIGGALVAWPLADRAMEVTYRRAVAFGGRGLARKPVTLALSATLVLVVLIGIARGVLQDFPNSGDEYCYLYQAQTFALGRVTNTPHPLQAFFDFYHVREAGGRLFSVFPPGWPAVLAVALMARVPLWIVNPILGLVTLGLTFAVGRRLYGECAAAISVVALAASPFFLFNSASYFAHALCAVFILAFAWSALRAADEQRAVWAVAAGAAVGAAFLTRNYTAVWCAMPFGVVLLRQGRRGWRMLCAAIAAGVPFVLVALAYNHATMGDPLAAAMGGGFEAYDERWFPVGWFGRGIEITAGHWVRFVGWTPPALLLLLPAAWLAAVRISALRFTDAIFPALIVGYFIYVDRGGNQYGPRYYYEAFPFVVLAVTAFVTHEPRYEDKTPGRRFAWYAYALSVAACVPLAFAHAYTEWAVVRERTEPYRLVASERIDHAVIFVASGSGWTRPMSARDLTRNSPDRSDRVLYVHDLGSDNAQLMRAYPDRSYFRYRFDPITRRGSLDALQPIGVPRQ